MKEIEIDFFKLQETLKKAKTQKQTEIQELYDILNLAADKILQGVLNRADVPTDILKILEGILYLRSTNFTIVNPRVALFWADEFKAWANKS